MKNTFDFHFHLLFKHFISIQRNGQKLPLEKDFKTKGVMAALDELMGNAFDSQSSPSMVKKSPLKCGVTALLAMEYAFAENISGMIRGFSNDNLPINWAFIDKVKNRQTSYFDLFKSEISFYAANEKALDEKFGIRFLNRKKSPGTVMDNPSKTYLAFSVEGGHNFSEAKIRTAGMVTDPSASYRKIQDDPDNIDLFSVNLTHLSEIPEQPLGGFAQGLTSTAQMAFRSKDFTPKTGFGLSELARVFIRSLYTHKFPTLLDVKHMSVYTRYQFYQYREDLIEEDPKIARLPIISSHTGFTFCPLEEFLEGRQYKNEVSFVDGRKITTIQAKNRKIGKTNFLLNNKLYCNPWTINLFDEEIVEIMRSGGLIGISLDQRVIGAAKSWVDGIRGEYFKDAEAIPLLEWEKWFREGKLDIEKYEEPERRTDRQVRHIMLFCHQLVYAVKIGYKNLPWAGNASPWDHLCLGSDFDGLINPINGYEDVTKTSSLRSDLKKYLPLAEKNMELMPEIKVFRRNADGNLDEKHLDDCINRFMVGNGQKILERFLKNWA